jgi:hypothetical protein
VEAGAGERERHLHDGRSAQIRPWFELTFKVETGLPYHLWIRGRAENDSYENDSVYVQYSGSTDADGAAINRIGTTNAASVIIEDGTNAGLSGWGWQDDAYGMLAGPFASGTQTIRVTTILSR